MTVLYVLLVLAGLVLPIGALSFFFWRARRDRLKIRADHATLRVYYSELARSDLDPDREKSLREKAGKILAEYDLRNMTFDDFNVLPLWIMSAMTRTAVPNAAIELLIVGVGLACQAAAALVSLGLS